MEPLLTVATFEWDGSDRSWVPGGVRAAASASGRDHLRQPTGVQTGGGHRQQIYVCPAAPEHPHTELMQ
ncbi:hypothetical protein [Streptomyces lavendulae]|uniref:hypothetical protein n=1 Tax=Streptomyces lavendulae TaxID=1914 RepID=UPI0031ECB69E